MADSKRLAVIKTLTELLQGITPANGFVSDLSTAVFRGITVFSNTDPLPMVCVVENPEPKSETTWVGDRTRYKHKFELYIQGFADAGQTATTHNSPDAAYDLMAEVQKQLALIVTPGNEFYRLRNLIVSFEVTPGTVRQDEGTGTHPMFLMLARIEVAENFADPYDR